MLRIEVMDLEAAVVDVGCLCTREEESVVIDWCGAPIDVCEHGNLSGDGRAILTRQIDVDEICWGEVEGVSVPLELLLEID